MALEKIKSERTIRALKPGAGRLNDGGGLYLVPFASEQSHCWRMDDAFESRRRTLANEVRTKLARGIDPMEERKAQRSKNLEAVKNESRIKAGLPSVGSFEDVARRWFDMKGPIGLPPTDLTFWAAFLVFWLFQDVFVLFSH